MSTKYKLILFMLPGFFVYGCSGGVDNNEPSSEVTTSKDSQTNANGEAGTETGSSDETGGVAFEGFLTQEDFKDGNAVKASSTESGMRRYLLQEISFKNPLYEHNEQEKVYVSSILSSSHCPEKLWQQLSAEVVDANTLIIKSISEDGYSISYDCSRAPPQSLIQLRTTAEIKGNFYYQAHCPNTDLSQYDGQSVESLAPLFPGQHPKVCPDDSERSIVMQYEFDLVTDSNFRLATGSRDRTLEHNLARYAFGSKDDITKPCKITKDGESFGLTDCKQQKWKQLISYEGWTNGEPDPSTSNLQGNETLSFETLLFDNLKFSGSISAYENGFIHFTHNDISGSVTYTPNEPTTYEVESSESGAMVIPWQKAMAQ